MPKFGSLKTFGIYCSSSLITTYKAPPNWLDADSYYLIPVRPENYAPEDAYIGETGMVPTFKRLAWQGPRQVIRGCGLTIPDGWAGLFYLVEHLAAQSASNPYQPVLIKDYLRPERADVAAAMAANTEPFTLRQGVISQVQLKQGLVGTPPKLWAAEGFSFKFQEQIARSV